MTLTMPMFDVLLQIDPNFEPVECRVSVAHGDQLRAELEAPRHMLPPIDQAPQHHTTLWVWAALLRTHVLPMDTSFATFKDTMIQTMEAVDETELQKFPGDPEDVTGPTVQDHRDDSR